MNKSWFRCASLAAALFAGAAGAAEAPLRVYAAGSLSGALGDIVRQYTAETGQRVEVVAGPAGLLRERIERGAAADVFLSANLAHPARLAAEGKATPPVVFVRNGLCVRARPALGLTGANLLDKLLQPQVRIGTSTPGADPGGDYAWQWFAKVEASRPGAGRILQGKALPLVGGPKPPAIPAHADAVKYFLAQGKVDVFFGYCSSHQTGPDPELTKVAVPADLAVPVDYAMSVLLRPGAAERQNAAYRFALYMLTPGAQRRLRAYGFVPVTQAAGP